MRWASGWVHRTCAWSPFGPVGRCASRCQDTGIGARSMERLRVLRSCTRTCRHSLLGLHASQNVAGRGIERHGGVVNRIIYYKLTINNRSEYLMVYLTPDGLVTDFDYADD